MCLEKERSSEIFGITLSAHVLFLMIEHVLYLKVPFQNLEILHWSTATGNNAIDSLSVSLIFPFVLHIKVCDRNYLKSSRKKGVISKHAKNRKKYIQVLELVTDKREFHLFVFLMSHRFYCFLCIHGLWYFCYKWK